MKHFSRKGLTVTTGTAQYDVMTSLHALSDLGEHEILSASEACEFLKISRPTLRKLANVGKVPFVKIGDMPMSHRKYRLKDLSAYIEQNIHNSTATKKD